METRRPPSDRPTTTERRDVQTNVGQAPMAHAIVLRKGVLWVYRTPRKLSHTPGRFNKGGGQMARVVCGTVSRAPRSQVGSKTTESKSSNYYF